MKTEVDYMLEMGTAGIRKHKVSARYEQEEAIVLYQVHFVGFNPVMIN